MSIQYYTRILFASLLVMFYGERLFAQQTYTYLFSTAPFNSSPAGGPALEEIGTLTTPVLVQIPASTCPDTPMISLTHFENNSGLKAKAFFTRTYSIEMIFKFDDVVGYNRIIDFSNGTSDYGIYTLGQSLNFYPYGNVGTLGIWDTTNYKQVVITRNDTTKAMSVYVNGSLFTNYTDASNYYVIGAAPNDTIRFFRDDVVVPNEAASGNVALLRMCDFVLDSATVVASYNSFCARITGIEQHTSSSNVLVYPNPANDLLSVRIPKAGADVVLQLTNLMGQVVSSTTLRETVTNVEVKALPCGVYVYRISRGGQVMGDGKVVIQHP